jgi:hypothetical protein
MLAKRAEPSLSLEEGVLAGGAAVDGGNAPEATYEGGVASTEGVYAPLVSASSRTSLPMELNAPACGVSIGLAVCDKPVLERESIPMKGRATGTGTLPGSEGGPGCLLESLLRAAERIRGSNAELDELREDVAAIKAGMKQQVDQRCPVASVPRRPEEMRGRDPKLLSLALDWLLQ